jgi:4-hydroxy-3-polyprenylbenzoate decarboxylase
MQPGNAYGEYLGYMAIPWKRRPEFEVTCITHRKGAFFVHLISQMPPSESSVTRVLGLENVLLKFLKIDCNNPAVLDVVVTEMSQNKYIVIKMKKTHPSQAWQALNGVAAYHPYVGKIVIAVDQDIDPRDHDAVIWALSTRMQPHRDIRVSRGKHPEVDLSAFRPDESLDYKQYPDDMGASILMIDATLKWPFSPVALPRKEFMEEALNIWKEEGLPELHLKEPWYGYELGYWPEEYRSDADQVVKGDHYLVGERLKKQRVKV